MNDKLAEALGFVSEKYICHAAKRKKIKLSPIVSTIAAMLAVVICLQTPNVPMMVTAKAVSLPTDNRWVTMGTPYQEEQTKRWLLLDAGMKMGNFTAKASEEVLSGLQNDNRIWSPVNAYIGLAMAAEMTEGQLQENVLQLLGSEDMDSLRGISKVWEAIYQDNGKEISTLANSLWLDEDVTYQQEIMDEIAYNYYASVYQGDLSSRKTNRDITNWLNNQTGGFMKNRTGKVALEDDCMIALASTVYFQGRWNERFDPQQNTKALFHSPSEDVECTFMNAKEMDMRYHWGEDYGAVYQWLENDASVWFILPDEDKTVEEVLAAGEYAKMITSDPYNDINSKQMLVNLSVPKFDVSSSLDLKESFSALGLGPLFDPQGNAFGNAVEGETIVWIGNMQQDSRVAIDEEGVTAASYLLIQGPGAAEPPDEIIDFILDRPFIIAITMHGVPMFVGVVNTP